MNLFVILCCATFLGVALLYAVAASLWFRFRWRVLGWKPSILNEEVVNRTVAECAPAALAELDGPALSEEQKRQRLQQLEWLFREVILRYAKNFTMHI